jgi:hypothetical protein
MSPSQTGGLFITLSLIGDDFRLRQQRNHLLSRLLGRCGHSLRRSNSSGELPAGRNPGAAIRPMGRELIGSGRIGDNDFS